MSKCLLLKLKNNKKGLPQSLSRGLPRAKSRGFTLMEILVAISLSMLLFGAIYGVYITSFKLYRKNVAQAEINQNGRIALERIARDLRQTKSTDIVSDIPELSEITVTNPAPYHIKFIDGHYKAPTNHPNNIQYIEYSLDTSTTNLLKRVSHYYFNDDPETWVDKDAKDINNFPANETGGDVGTEYKADKITSLKFYGNNSLITIELVAQDNKGNSNNFQTEVYVRN